VSEQLGVSRDSVHTNSTYVDDLGGDDLDLREAAMALEEEFNIEIPDSYVEKMEYCTVGDTIRYLIKRLQ
jgi:acyl carrier protein